MSKAILVIDTPESCGECLCFIERDRFDGNEWHSTCRKLRKEVSDYDKPKDCPLKPMPEIKKPRDPDETWNEMLIRRGYNDCIDEILGREEDE